MIKAGEEIIAGSNEQFRVVDVVQFDEEDDSPFVELLQVEAASRPLSIPTAPAGSAEGVQVRPPSRVTIPSEWRRR